MYGVDDRGRSGSKVPVHVQKSMLSKEIKKLLTLAEMLKERLITLLLLLSSFTSNNYSGQYFFKGESLWGNLGLKTP